MAEYIDPAAVWTAIQAIQGGGGGGVTPNTTTGYVTDNFNSGGGGTPPAGGLAGAQGAAYGASTANPNPSGGLAGAQGSTYAPNGAGGPGSPNVTVPGSSGGGGGGGGGGAGGDGVWGNPATQDSPDAWFAKAVLAAIGNPTQLQHILDSVNGPNGPQGSLKEHYLSLIQGVMAGNADKIAEAKLYATNPSDPYGPGAANNGPSQ